MKSYELIGSLKEGEQRQFESMNGVKLEWNGIRLYYPYKTNSGWKCDDLSVINNAFLGYIWKEVFPQMTFKDAYVDCLKDTGGRFEYIGEYAYVMYYDIQDREVIISWCGTKGDISIGGMWTKNKIS